MGGKQCTVSSRPRAPAPRVTPATSRGSIECLPTSTRIAATPAPPINCSKSSSRLPLRVPRKRCVRGLETLFYTREMKTVLVTGASRGLGLELARQYVHKKKEDGDYGPPAWRVVVCCRGDPPHKELFDELRQGYGGCTSLHSITLDVACSDAFDANFRNALADIGRIDVLINNAGVCIGRECAVGNVDYDAWTRSFNTNVMGSMRVLEHCQPHLAPDASVVNISGRMGSIGRVLSGLGISSATTQDVVYRTTKAALNMMTVCAAAEMRTNPKTKSVKLIAVDPGWMNTDMGSRGGTIKAPLEPRESAAGIVALIESLTPEDSGKFLNWRGEEMPW